jgi:hypothetical protein
VDSHQYWSDVPLPDAVPGPSDDLDVVDNYNDAAKHHDNSGEHDNNHCSGYHNSDYYSADDSSGSDHNYGAFSTLDHDSA